METRERKHRKDCLYCLNEFNAYRPSDKFCSTICRSRHYRRVNKVYLKRLKREWDSKNADKKQTYERDALQEKARLRKYRKNYQLKRYFGITLDEYNDILEAQGGVCALCGREPPKEGRSLAVDHAHQESNYVPKAAIRGILCWTCNTKLIGRHTDPDIFLKAHHYLQQHTGKFVPEEYITGRRKKRRKKR